MSDVEDDPIFANGDHDSGAQDEMDTNQDGQVDVDFNQPQGEGRRRDSEDEEEEEEEEEEDEDEDEEEEQSGQRQKKRAKHRHKRSAPNPFLDIEAEVEEDEEEDEEDEEELGQNDFLANGVDGDEDDFNRRTADHARLDRRERELDDQDLAKIAQDLSKKYGKAAVRYTGDMNEVPQRLLMPSVHDCSLWQVRVKPGRERDIVFSLMRKAIDLEYTARPLQILSAFQRDSLQGMIYVEARSSQHVSMACTGLVGVYPSRGISLVPIEEMASLLQIKKQEQTVTPGSWVRIRRGKYQGDLAQVMDITENGEDVGLKFIPRIDLNPRDDATTDGKKRKKNGATGTTMRPPQRFFNYEEVIKVWGRKQVSKRNQVYVFQNDTYKDGFIEKDFKLSALQLEDVNPTLDEITLFTRGQGGTENETNVDLSVIAEASRKAAISVLQPGDHVEVFEGEQSGVHGVVQEISGDTVTITASGVDIDGQKIDLPARSVRKKFKPGDHVKVMSGQNADETGLVVAVAENIVTFLSDMSMQEVSVFSKDLREAAEVGSGTNIVGSYELHDLVQIDSQTVGVIFKTERDSFRVLDQNGQVRLVQPHQISMRRDSNRAIATDSEGHVLRVSDNMKEIDGEGRKGRVLHIHQSFFAFLHNRDITENGGVFVTRARSLASLAPKGNLLKLGGADLSKMNPALVPPTGGMVGSGAMGRGPRDRCIGETVTVVKGPHKGYVGIIKDTNGPTARVELNTGNKIVSIDKDKLMMRNNAGALQTLDAMRSYPNGSASQTSHTPSQFGGRTPAWGVGRTPNLYDTGKTPAWNASSRTPNPYADNSGKTPAWNASSRTPNPYADSGRTPSWNPGSRTPNPYAAWATPKPPGAGGATPRPAGAWGTNEGWGSPAWGRNDDSWAGAPTPGAHAPTPGFGAPTTPAASHTPWNSYETPGGVFGTSFEQTSAPTPLGEYSVNQINPPTFTVHDKWLVEPAIQGHKFLVTVMGTRLATPPYRDGDFEGRQGYVDSVFNPQVDSNAAHAQTAEVVFDNNLSEKVTFLIKYLVPVQPSRVKDRVVPLAGSHVGKPLIIQQYDSEECVVSGLENGGVVFDVYTSLLAKVR